MDMSDQELGEQLQILIFQPGFKLTTLNDVVQSLESELGVNLSHKSSLIREQVNLILAAAYPAYSTVVQCRNFHSQDGEIKDSELPKRNQSVNLDQQMELKAEADSQDAETKGSDVAKRNQFVDPTQQMVSKAEADLQDKEIKGSDEGKRYRYVSPHPRYVFRFEVDQQDAEVKGSDEAKSVPAKKRDGVGGLNKACRVTPELQVIVDHSALPRTEIVRRLWAYIRRNKLQDPSNKKKIICDDALRAVFETDCTDMFKMNKLLSKHIIPLEPPKEEMNQAKRLNIEIVDGAGLLTGNVEPETEKWMMTEALVHFYGTGEREVSKSEVLRRIWEHITANNLKHPMNRDVVLCDAELQHLFGWESFLFRDISEMIDDHLFKPF